MAAIYLQHPRHGAKVAISEDEAVYDETEGWTRYDPVSAPPQPAKLEDVSADPPIRRRRARQE
jgi:hypothetical protein